jgi:hypothetical protein
MTNVSAIRALLCGLIIGMLSFAGAARAQAPARPGAVVVRPTSPTVKRQQLSDLQFDDLVGNAQAICAALKGKPEATQFQCQVWEKTTRSRAVRDFQGKTCKAVEALASIRVPPAVADKKSALMRSCRVTAASLRATVTDACTTAVATAQTNATHAHADAAKALAAEKNEKDETAKKADAVKENIQSACKPAAIQALDCSTLGSLPDDLRSVGKVDEAAEIDLTCGSESTGGLDLASIGTVALQGLGDYLTAIAKQELVDYALERFGRDFCKNGSKFEGSVLFPITCTAVFPNGTDDPADTSVILTGKLPGLLKQDVEKLPATVVVRALDSSADEDLKKLLNAVLGDLINQISTAPDVLTLLQKLRDDGRGAAIKPNCVFTPKDQPLPECAVALFLEVAGAAKESLVVSGNVTPTSIQTWLETGATNFCVNYGPAGATDGSCVYGASPEFWDQLTTWTNSVVALYKQLFDTAQALSKAVAAGRFDSETHPIANSEISDGFRAFFSASLDAYEFLNQADASWKKGSNKDKLARSGVDMVAAAIGKDSATVLADLSDIVANPIVGDKLDANVVRSVAFVAAMAQAKTRDDARQVIEDAAAPIGTYKAKFTANTTMINGYVGFFGVERTPLSKRESDPGYTKLDASVYRPLSAPVGVEFSYRLSEKWHGGFAILALDPLAIKVVDQGGTYRTDFKDVLMPGLLGHISILNSPLDLVAGAVVQPTARSAETCNDNHACWRAPISLMAGLVVDAPLLQLH